MTPQEKQMLESLASRVAGTPVPQKDPEADALIQSRLGANPDALYILTQTALIQEIALNQANAKLHELQQQQGSQHTSFLGRLFGSPSGGPPPPPPAYAQYQQPPYQPPPQYAPAPPPVYQQPPGPGSSFLRSAAVTATGVAAGALAFEGIESLMHGGFGGGGYGGGGSFLQGGAPTEVINNYYEEPRDDGGVQASNADYDDSQQYDNSDDTSNTDFDDSGSSGDDYSSSDV
jgi:hypothetical protein